MAISAFVDVDTAVELYMPSFKICTKCRALRPREQFNRTTKSPDGRRTICRDCQGAYNRTWNKANRPAMNAATKAWRARNPDKVKAQKTAWRHANPDRVRAHKRTEYERHAEKIQARVARWIADNPERKRAHGRTRRARLANAAGTDYTTVQQLADRWEFYGGLCFYCGTEADTFDHRIPLVRGGTHFPANLVPACRSCNCRKHDKTETEFLALLRG